MKGGPEGGPRPASQVLGQGDRISAGTSSPHPPTTPLFDEGRQGSNSCPMTTTVQALSIYCVLGSSKKNPQNSLTGPLVSPCVAVCPRASVPPLSRPHPLCPQFPHLENGNTRGCSKSQTVGPGDRHTAQKTPLGGVGWPGGTDAGSQEYWTPRPQPAACISALGTGLVRLLSGRQAVSPPLQDITGLC